jgi:hypothetical protein
VRKNFSCFLEILSTFRFQQECLNTLSTYTWIKQHYLITFGSLLYNRMHIINAQKEILRTFVFLLK